MRELGALSLGGAVCGVLGGIIFWAIHGGTLITRSIAYGLWFAATVILVLTVVDTEPGVKGDTVSNVTKPATLETGGVVAVPLFVNVGDKLKIDPHEKRYISRA